MHIEWSHDTRMPNITPSEPRNLLIACLCAQWCGTCKDYQVLFNALQPEFEEVRFLWVDIEDEAALVEPVDIENFPTILIARGNDACFFGTVTPHLETLRRLIQSFAADGAALLQDAQTQALAQRLCKA
jgi:thioredoxin 1